MEREEYREAKDQRERDRKTRDKRQRRKDKKTRDERQRNEKERRDREGKDHRELEKEVRNKYAEVEQKSGSGKSPNVEDASCRRSAKGETTAFF